MCLLQLPLFPLLPSLECGGGDEKSGRCCQCGEEKFFADGHGRWGVVEVGELLEGDIRSESSILEVKLDGVCMIFMDQRKK